MRDAGWNILEKAQLPTGHSKAILHVVELELNSHWGNLASRSDLDQSKLELRAEMALLRSEVIAELQKAKLEMIKWMIGLMVAQGGLIWTACYFLATHLRR